MERLSVRLPSSIKRSCKWTHEDVHLTRMTTVHSLSITLLDLGHLMLYPHHISPLHLSLLLPQTMDYQGGAQCVLGHPSGELMPSWRFLIISREIK